jgi:hypothetical protein
MEGTYMSMFDLSKIRSAARNKAEISRLSVPTFSAIPRHGCKQFREWLAPDTDPGRCFGMKATGCLGADAGGIRVAFGDALGSFSPSWSLREWLS